MFSVRSSPGPELLGGGQVADLVPVGDLEAQAAGEIGADRAADEPVRSC